jgi:hypothetical protein
LSFQPVLEETAGAGNPDTMRMMLSPGLRASAGLDFVFLRRLSASFDLRYLCVFGDSLSHEITALLSVGVLLPIGAPFL